MTMIRNLIFAALAAVLVGFGTQADAQSTNTTAAGEYTGWVQWGGENRINNVGWYLNADGTMRTASSTPEYGYWLQTGDYVEFIYFCSGEFLCHYRGRIYNGVISGAATTNQNHTASFEMRRQR
jgi:hypothetical protein